MKFKEVIGNSELAVHLKAMVDENRVSHALLFIEEEGQGAMAWVWAMIQYMSCRNKHSGDSCSECPDCIQISKLMHPDLHFSFPVSNKKNTTSEEYLNLFREVCLKNPYFKEETLNSQIGIEDKLGAINVSEAKSIIRQMNFKSYEGGNKYMIIYLPERMSTEASNRLLKLIEEPSDGTYFFLITHCAENVISTIRSRCLRINLRPMDYEELALVLASQLQLDAATAKTLAKTSGGNYGKALESYRLRDELSPFLKISSEILRSCIRNDLEKLMDLSVELASYGREKQKNFYLYFESFLRKAFICKIGMEDISYSTEIEKKEIWQIQESIPAEFYEKAYGYIDNARIATESNVNAKMVFNNMMNLLLMNYIKTKRQNT